MDFSRRDEKDRKLIDKKMIGSVGMTLVSCSWRGSARVAGEWEWEWEQAWGPAKHTEAHAGLPQANKQSQRIFLHRSCFNSSSIFSLIERHSTWCPLYRALDRVPSRLD